MDILQYVKQKADLQSLLLSAGTICAGTATAAIRGNMEILPASVCLLFALVMQLGCNLFHYYTFLRRRAATGSDAKTLSINVQASETEMRLLREGSTACLIISLMLGLTVMSMSTHLLLGLATGICIYGIVYIMAAFPKINRNPVSLLLTFLIFGPIGVVGTCFVQYQYEATRTLLTFFDLAPSVYLGTVMGLLACSHHLVMSYFNSRIEPNKNRSSLIRYFGYRGAEWIIGINGLCVFILFVAMVFLLKFPEPLVALAPGFIAFCINTYIAFRIHRVGIGELRFLNTLSRINFLLTGLCSFILWWIIGSPDDSMRVFFPVG